MELTMTCMCGTRPRGSNVPSRLPSRAAVARVHGPAVASAGTAAMAAATAVYKQGFAMIGALVGDHVQDVTGRAFWNRLGPPSGRAPV